MKKYFRDQKPEYLKANLEVEDGNSHPNATPY